MQELVFPIIQNWIAAKNNNGIFVDQTNLKVYIIKKDSRLRVLNKNECEQETAKRLEIFESSKQLIIDYFNSTDSNIRLELFGSVANGCACENSDIDINVYTEVFNSNGIVSQFAALEHELKNKSGFQFQFRLANSILFAQN
jgi:predicted nucleotidyltransferase